MLLLNYLQLIWGKMEIMELENAGKLQHWKLQGPKNEDFSECTILENEGKSRNQKMWEWGMEKNSRYSKMKKTMILDNRRLEKQ